MKKKLLFICLLTAFFVNAKAEIIWPETVNEWGLESVTSIATNEIVYYNNAFYQCTADIAVEAGKDPETATANFTKIADCQMWEVSGSDDWIPADSHVIYFDNKVYKALQTTSSYSIEWWSPIVLGPEVYETICDVALIEPREFPEPPTVELPENYVGYWTDDISWSPGFHAIYNGKVFPCIATTTITGGEHPETEWGYWGGSVGDEVDLLSLVTVPAWDDTRVWPIGAIVSYNDNVHKCLAATHIDGGEHPETGWGYWEILSFDITGFNNMINTVDYAIQEGRLYFTNNPTELHLQLYNIVGQLINESTKNGMELPSSGTFIVKAVVDGNPTSFKVVR